jgi:Cytochrome c554 and c-prime
MLDLASVASRTFSQESAKRFDRQGHRAFAAQGVESRMASVVRMALSCALSGILFLGVRSDGQQLPGAPQPEQNLVRVRPKLAGDGACLGCHEQQSTSYRSTSHHLTSRLAGPDAILGSFSGSGSTLKIIDPLPGSSAPALSFRMEVRDGGYYETAIAGVPGHEQSHGERIDVVTGSGTRGQSYLYWLEDQLFELPLSYWSDGHQWINSPGFKDKTANFSRPIYPRCLECHATYIVPLSPDPLSNHYDRSTLVTGISCETCHGPGGEHVAVRAATSAGSSGEKTILNPARFSRDRQVDLCALCHSGAQRVELEPAFSYLPGQPLDGYLKPLPADTTMQPEVHGNQVGLLKRSRCYVSSPTMSCSTCHDVHAPERPAATYSSRCLSCHRVESCTVAKTPGLRIADNCIDCHMPKLPTNAIIAKTGGNEVRATMRTHWIRVYPTTTQP